MSKEFTLFPMIVVLANLTASSLAFGATQEDCDWYAQDAIIQYKQAQSLKIPNVSYPVWSTNYEHHFNWCIKTPLSEVSKGRKLRANVIKNHCLKHYGAYGVSTRYKGGGSSLPAACTTGVRTGYPAFTSTMKAKPIQQPMSTPKQPPQWTR